MFTELIRWSVRRVFEAVLLLFATSVLLFALIDFVPGDFYETLHADPRISQQTAVALRARYGLQRGLAVQYLDWLRSTARGEGGVSLGSGLPAGPIVLERGRNTLLLTGTGTAFAWLLAVPIGLYAGGYRGSVFDEFATALSSFLLSVPEIVMALFLLVLALRTGWFSAGGVRSVAYAAAGASDRAVELLAHIFIPSLCLAAALLPLLVLQIRAAVAEALNEPFVLAAKGYGMPFRRILWRYVLPSAANPAISLFGFSIGMLTGSSLLVETIFGWPGLGQLMVQAIQQRDTFVVVDAAVLAAAFLVMGNTIADVLLYANDPRIRRG